MTNNNGSQSSWITHPITIAVVTPLTAAILGGIGYLSVNRETCPKIEKSVNTKNLAKFDYINPIEDGNSNVYKKNKQLFSKLENEKNIDEQKKIKNLILTEYFKNNNSEFFKHLNSTNQSIINNNFIGLTYLYGIAGIGKSFIRNPIKKLYGNNSCVIKLGDKIKPEKNYGSEIKQERQLYSDSIVLSKLPKITGRFNLKSLLEQSDCILSGEHKKVVIIDDLDEIHPDSSTLILKSIDEFLEKQRNNNGQDLHFIVFGRPEAFNYHLSHPKRQYVNNFRKFKLKGTGYTHSSDISLMSFNYFIHKKNELKPKDIDSTIIKRMKQKPFLFETSKNNLASSNFVIESIRKLEKDFSKSNTVPDIKYKEELFENYLSRNHKSHNRPELNGINGKRYKHLLQNIAEKYLESVNNQGYFRVSINDSVPVLKDILKSSYDALKLDANRNCKLDIYNFNVQQTLEYSGIVNIRPIDQNTKEYKFTPLWLHEFLVNTRRERN